MLNAQALVSAENSAEPKPSYVGTPTKTHTYALWHLMRNNVGYLQIVEDDVVFLQIVEDDVVFMKSIIDSDIKIRQTNKSDKKTVEFIKGSTVLKRIVEDDVVFLKRIVEDDVVFLKRIVEDDVVFLKRIVEDDVVFLKGAKNAVDSLTHKDNTNLPNTYNTSKINVDSLKKAVKYNLKQVRHDSLERANAVQHWSLGISAGVVSVPGFDVAYKFSSHWTARLGYGYLDYGVTNYTYNYNKSDAAGKVTSKSFLINAAAHLSNISGLIEYGVGPKGRFRLIGGAAYFPDKKLTASGELKSEFKFGAVTLQPSEVGSGGVEVGFAQKISPYLGFGIGRSTPRRRLNLSLDFGAYYMGDYRIKLNVEQESSAEKARILLKQNEENGAIIERNLNARFFNKVLPSANFRLAYRLH